MLEMEGVSKTHISRGYETAALNKISLKIRSGEFLAIRGPSGSGKSTLLNLLGLIDRPTRGHYKVEGHDTDLLSPADLTDLRRKSFGFVFQAFNLIDDLSVHTNVALPLKIDGLRGRKLRLRVREALEMVGMNHRADHKPSQLSGGEQQRIAIARALIRSPSIILADEPTGNLDSEHGAEILSLLEMLHEQGSTIVLVTHSNSIAFRSERIIDLHDGQVYYDRIPVTLDMSKG